MTEHQETKAARILKEKEEREAAKEATKVAGEAVGEAVAEATVQDAV